MAELPNDDSTPVHETTRRPRRTPSVGCFGTLTEITQAVKSKGLGDGGLRNRRRTG
jgi:hypothetical protein